MDTRAFVLCPGDSVKDSNVGFEYGIILKDQIIGTNPVPASQDGGLGPHKDIDHDHLFFFPGTNPDNPSEFDGEIEFW